MTDVHVKCDKDISFTGDSMILFMTPVLVTIEERERETERAYTRIIL